MKKNRNELLFYYSIIEREKLFVPDFKFSYNDDQMKEILLAIIERVDYNWLLNPNIPAESMFNIRLTLLDGDPLIHLFKEASNYFIDSDELDLNEFVSFKIIEGFIDNELLPNRNFNIFHPNLTDWILIDYDEYPLIERDGVLIDSLHDLDQYFSFDADSHTVLFNPPANTKGLYFNNEAWELVDKSICSNLSFFNTVEDAEIIIGRLSDYFETAFPLDSIDFSL